MEVLPNYSIMPLFAASHYISQQRHRGQNLQLSNDLNGEADKVVCVLLSTYLAIM